MVFVYSGGSQGITHASQMVGSFWDDRIRIPAAYGITIGTDGIQHRLDLDNEGIVTDGYVKCGDVTANTANYVDVVSTNITTENLSVTGNSSFTNISCNNITVAERMTSTLLTSKQGVINSLGTINFEAREGNISILKGSRASFSHIGSVSSTVAENLKVEGTTSLQSVTSGNIDVTGGITSTGDITRGQTVITNWGISGRMGGYTWQFGKGVIRPSNKNIYYSTEVWEEGIGITGSVSGNKNDPLMNKETGKINTKFYDKGITASSQMTGDFWDSDLVVSNSCSIFIGTGNTGVSINPTPSVRGMVDGNSVFGFTISDLIVGYTRTWNNTYKKFLSSVIP